MDKFELTSEILHQVSQCKTVEEILEKAKEFDKDITLEQAQWVFDFSHASGAISDEELDNVAGGNGCFDFEVPACPKCKTNAHVTMRKIIRRRSSMREYTCSICGSKF